MTKSQTPNADTPKPTYPAAEALLAPATSEIASLVGGVVGEFDTLSPAELQGISLLSEALREDIFYAMLCPGCSDGGNDKNPPACIATFSEYEDDPILERLQWLASPTGALGCKSKLVRRLHRIFERYRRTRRGDVIRYAPRDN